MPISSYAFIPTKRSRRIVETRPVHILDKIPGFRYLPNYTITRKDSRCWDWHIWKPNTIHSWFTGLEANNPGCAVEVPGIPGECSRFGLLFSKARAIHSWKHVVLLSAEGEYRLAYFMEDPINCDLIHEYCSVILTGTCAVLIGPHDTTFFAITAADRGDRHVYPLKEVGRSTIGDWMTRDELDDNIVLI